KKDIENFVSKSGIFTDGELSTIIGRTIVGKNKINFIGLIKGETSASSLGSSLQTIQRKQFTQALEKLANAVAKAQSKDRSKVAQLYSNLASTPNVSVNSKAPRSVKTITRQQQLSPQKSITNQTFSQKSETKLVSKTKGKTKQSQNQRQLQRQKQDEKQLQKLNQINKQVQKLNQQQKLTPRQKTRLKNLQRMAQRIIIPTPIVRLSPLKVKVPFFNLELKDFTPKILSKPV